MKYTAAFLLIVVAMSVLIFNMHCNNTNSNALPDFTITKVRLEDASGNTKTVFTPGEQIRVKAMVKNIGYTLVREGDGWDKISIRLSAPELKYDRTKLMAINPDLQDLKPGQKIRYFAVSEIPLAKKWVKLCIDAHYKDPIYFQDQEMLSLKNIEKATGKDLLRFSNYAEAMQKTRPVPVVDISQLRP